MKAVAAQMAGRIKSERLALSLDVLPGDGHQGPHSAKYNGAVIPSQ
jgi:hypothetical protein